MDMKGRARLPGVILGLFCVVQPVWGVDATVEYRLAMPEPWTHLFRVEMRVAPKGQLPDSLDVVLPVWRAGRYVVLDFAGGVVEFNVEDDHGEQIPWRKVDKTTWRIDTGAGQGVIVARYTVYANEFNLRTRGLNDEHGFVDGKAVFMYAPAYRSVTTRLTIEPYGSWTVTTAHRPEEEGRWSYRTTGYDQLVDDPFEFGNPVEVAFEVEGIPHLLSFSRPLQCDMDRLVADVTRIVQMNRRFWGSLPYDRYVFIVHVAPGAGGGTEHMNSSVIGVAPRPFGAPESCSSLLGLFSHEFFHTWNVKRLRPRGMDPYDWTGETYFRELWIVEGGTSYMHNLLRVREGLSTLDGHLQGIAAAAGEERSRPGNRIQSPIEASFDAWIKGFRGREQAENFQSNVYGRGAQVCLVMDLELRRLNDNNAGFGDLLRALYGRFPLGSGGYTVEDVEGVAVQLGGEEMKSFFDAYVRGTTPLPWEAALRTAGLMLEPRDSTRTPWFGLETRMNGERVVVRQVVAGSPAYRDGVSIDDEIVAVDGVRAGGPTLREYEQGAALGVTVELTILRDDLLHTLHVTLDQPAPPEYVVRRVPDPTPAQRTTFERWVGIPWPEE